MARFHITNIRWDFSDEDNVGVSYIDSVPTDTFIDLDDDVLDLEEDVISDILGNCISEAYGFCHFGFEYSQVIEEEDLSI